MTEQMLLKLEEKMMTLFAELDGLRKENTRLKQENTHLRTEQSAHSLKLQDLLSLLDTLDMRTAVPLSREQQDYVSA